MRDGRGAIYPARFPMNGKKEVLQKMKTRTYDYSTMRYSQECRMRDGARAYLRMRLMEGCAGDARVERNVLRVCSRDWGGRRVEREICTYWELLCLIWRRGIERRAGLIDRMFGWLMVMVRARMEERVNEWLSEDKNVDRARKMCRDFGEWLKAEFEDGEVAEEKVVETP